jgi:hypothetical protein
MDMKEYLLLIIGATLGASACTSNSGATPVHLTVNPAGVPGQVASLEFPFVESHNSRYRAVRFFSGSGRGRISFEDTAEKTGHTQVGDVRFCYRAPGDVAFYVYKPGMNLVWIGSDASRAWAFVWGKEGYSMFAWRHKNVGTECMKDALGPGESRLSWGLGLFPIEGEFSVVRYSNSSGSTVVQKMGGYRREVEFDDRGLSVQLSIWRESQRLWRVQMKDYLPIDNDQNLSATAAAAVLLPRTILFEATSLDGVKLWSGEVNLDLIQLLEANDSMFDLSSVMGSMSHVVERNIFDQECTEPALQ